MTYDDFRYAEIALGIKYLDTMAVTRSDFAKDKEAIAVTGTANNDAALPCLPPWLSVVDATEDWFGPTGSDVTGLPAPSIGIGGVIGNIPGLKTVYASVFAAFTTEANLTWELKFGDDTVPWEIYSCLPGVPPIPLTPVIFSPPEPPQNGPWFEDPEVQN